MPNCTNTSPNNGTGSFFPFQPETVICMYVLYPTIFFLSGAGNIMVCMVVFHRYRSKTLRNYYVLILNLAISDFTAAALAQFDVGLVAEGMVWIYGDAMCQLLQALHNITYYTSVWTLAAISLVRYRGIIYPLGRQVNNKQAFMICIVIWVSVTLIRLPSIITRKYNPGLRSCNNEWESLEQYKANDVSMAVLLFVVPFCITVAAYCRIAHRVGTRVRMASKSDAKQAQETRKIIRMLVIATSFFFMCVIPLQILYLLGTFNHIVHFEYFADFSVFVQILALMHTAINPICYTLSNDQFRKEIYASCFCVEKVSNVSGRSTIHSKGSNGQTLRTHAASVTTVEYIGSEDEKSTVPKSNVNETRF